VLSVGRRFRPLGVAVVAAAAAVTGKVCVCVFSFANNTANTAR